MTPLSPRILLVVCLLGASPAAVFASDLAADLATTRAKCGYDLTALSKQLQSAQSESAPNDGLRMVYALGWQAGNVHIDGTMTFNCNASRSTPADPSAPVLTPRALIEEEDAGGRYGRHVAWQKSVKASNWAPQVAYVDYTLGDSERTRSNDFLVCDSQVARPCIALSITRPAKLSTNDTAAVMALIGRITVQR